MYIDELNLKFIFKNSSYIYDLKQDFKNSYLFLDFEKISEDLYSVEVTIKSPGSQEPVLAKKGIKLLKKAVEIKISNYFFKQINLLQKYRHLLSMQANNLMYENFKQLQQKISEKLYELIINQEIRLIFESFIDLLEKEIIKNLTLIILLNEEQVNMLPFEMLYEQIFKKNIKNVLWNKNFAIIRSNLISPVFFNPISNNNLTAPLKLLFIISIPENLSEEDKCLEIEKEQKKLIANIKNVDDLNQAESILIEFLDVASLREIDEALSLRKHDIVHISGHGGYNFKSQQGILYLEDYEGKIVATNGRELGQMLEKHESIKLLILSACETGAGVKNGIVQQLSQYKIPVIIAMQYSISDANATDFTTELYTSIANGTTFTVAVNNARQKLWQKTQNSYTKYNTILEWFIPVIFQNKFIDVLYNKNNYDKKITENFYSKLDQSIDNQGYNDGFIGRKDYLKTLTNLFNQQKTVCIYGFGGLGKTRLAQVFIYNYNKKIYANNIIKWYGDIEIHEEGVLEKIFVQYTLFETDFEQIESVKALLDNNDIKTNVCIKMQILIDNYLNKAAPILFFDNFEDCLDENRKLKNKNLQTILQYLINYPTQNYRIIFTSRYKFEEIENIIFVQLNKLGFAEQYRFINYSEVLRQLPKNTIEELCKRIDGHPQIMLLLEALIKENKDFNWLIVSKLEKQLFKSLLLQKLFSKLSKRTQYFFRIISIFITPSNPNVLQSLTQQTKIKITKQLKILNNNSLCFYNKTLNVFEVHALTRTWINQNFPFSEQEYQEITTKIGNYYWEESKTEKHKITNITLAKEYYILAKAWSKFAEASFIIQNYFQNIGSYNQSRIINENVLKQNISDLINANVLFYLGEIEEAQANFTIALSNYNDSLEIMIKIKNKQGEAKCLCNIGMVYFYLCEYDISLSMYQKSLKIFQQINGKQGIAKIFNNIGIFYYNQGNFQTSIVYNQKSIKIQEEIKDNEGVSKSLYNLGIIYAEKGEYEKAEEHFKNSWLLIKEQNNKQNESNILYGIGNIYFAQNNYTAALKYFEESLNLKQLIGDKYGESLILNALSQYYKLQGIYESALEYLEKSLKISKSIGDLQGQSNSIGNIALIYFEKGDFDNALEIFLQDLRICVKIGNKTGEANVLNNISQIYEAKGEFENASKYLEQSLELHNLVGDKNGLSTTLNNLGELYYIQQYYEKALHYYHKSLEISIELNNLYQQGIAYNNIAQVYGKLEKYDITLEYLLKSLEISKKINDAKNIATVLNNIYQIYENKQDWTLAKEYLLKSLEIRQELGELIGIGITLNNLGSMNVKQKKYEEAIPYLLQSLDIFQKSNSHYAKYPENHLNNIKTILNEDKYNDILEKYKNNLS